MHTGHENWGSDHLMWDVLMCMWILPSSTIKDLMYGEEEIKGLNEMHWITTNFEIKLLVHSHFKDIFVWHPCVISVCFPAGLPHFFVIYCSYLKQFSQAGLLLLSRNFGFQTLLYRYSKQEQWRVLYLWGPFFEEPSLCTIILILYLFHDWRSL